MSAGTVTPQSERIIVTFPVDREMKDAIVSKAREHDRSLAAEIRVALRAYLGEPKSDIEAA